ncbi:MAG: SPOR domain-containing protein [Candidatus Glassbacteria bacterium]
MRRIAGLALSIALLGAVAGCSVIRDLRDRIRSRREPAGQVVQARSVLDSVWLSGSPVDTVRLQPLPAGAAAGPVELPERRRAPAAIEIAAPEKVAGYRVQLASSQSREELAALLRRVEREFGLTPYLEGQEGFFTLRIGAFLDRQDAAAERERAVSYGYKYAWIVQTYVSPGEIKRKEQ